MTKTALVLLSGGMDSAAALWWARERYRDVMTLAFVVPSTPAGERRAAKALSKAAGAAEHREVELPFLTNHVKGKPDGYLPQRNLIYYAIAGSLAEQMGAVAIVGGHLATDAEDFPDARAEYFERVEAMTGIRVVLPFIRKRKADVVRYGLRRGVPFDKTWSCYRNGSRPCGACVSCLERAAAIGHNGATTETRRRYPHSRYAAEDTTEAPINAKGHNRGRDRSTQRKPRRSGP
jgi:7-cyano-7-deazaguanine synthase